MTQTKQLLKEAFAAIQKLKKERKTHRDAEPIAIVSMACRLPGGILSPEDYWAMLSEGREGIGKVPESRWDKEAYFDPDPSKPHKMYIEEGGFLTDDIRTFDAALFGISPKEAEEMDPQHRMLLELSWEAFENAGMDPTTLKEKRGGVFVGIISSEYSMLERDSRDISPYTLTGMTPHMASGRLSHFYGLRGPSISMDTACSSSLVALHTAVNSLNAGECDFALACGVNLMVSPEAMVALCKVRALSKEGRCKPFDANGDGYGRGEGGGIVLLKRLSQAKKDGDPILAVVKGSAINHDGPTSGLTVPNMRAQSEVIESALAAANLGPEEVSLIEAHGTGTHLGDPIEIQALEKVYGTDKRKSPLYLGSSKANLGHCEAAAGIAAVIKTVLCLQQEQVPPHVNFKTLNPRIDLSKLHATLPLELSPWKGKAAGISSFGFSGTNAHVILQKWEEEKEVGGEPLFGLPLSAHTKEALDEIVGTYCGLIETLSDDELETLQYQVLTCRPQLKHRATFFAETKEALVREIQAYLNGTPGENTVYLKAPQKLQTIIELDETTLNSRRIHVLYEEKPLFKAALDKCASYFEEPVDLEGKTQASTFCAQYALIHCLHDWGLPLHTLAHRNLGKGVAIALSKAMPLKEVCQTIEKGEDFDLSQLKPKLRLIETSKIAEEEGCLHLSREDFEGDMRSALLELFSKGVTINWRVFLSKEPCGPISLPNYPFSKKAYWIEQKPVIEMEGDPLKGKPMPSPLPIFQHRFCLSTENLPELLDTHRIAHVGFLLEMIGSAISSNLNVELNQVELHDLKFDRALHIAKPMEVVATIEKEKAFSLYSNREGKWELNLKGRVSPKPSFSRPKVFALPTEAPDFDRQSFYQLLEKRDLHLGESVRWVEAAWKRENTIYARLSCSSRDSHGVFDAVAQLFHLGLKEDESHVKLMVVAWKKARLFQNPNGGQFTCSIDLDKEEAHLFNQKGECVFSCLGHEMKRLETRRVACVHEEGEDLTTFVRRLLAELLKMDASEISDDDTLYELGFDSIVGMDLRKSISTSLGVELDLEILFKNPTILEVAEQLSSSQKIPKSPSHPWFRGAYQKTELPRLFCLPYGCGGASEYFSWVDALDGVANVIPVQLPGREDRIEEKPYEVIEELAKALVSEIEDLEKAPFAFYGHSMGALIAFRLVIELRKRKKPLPSHLFVGAYSSPTILPNPWLAAILERLKREGIERIPDPTQQIDDLEALLPKVMEGYAEIGSLEEGYVRDLIPTIFADLRLVESFQMKKVKPLDIPITAFTGRDDDRVTIDEMSLWKALTKDTFQLHELSGDHFFLAKDQSQKELINTIHQTLNH